MKGSYKVGFNLQNKNFFVKAHKANVIAAYGVTFNKRAVFVYQVMHQLSGFFIRKSKWQEIIQNEEYAEIVFEFKKRICYNF